MPDPDYWHYVTARVLENLDRTSRTARTGTIDTTVNPDKAAGTVERSEVRGRVLSALAFLEQALPIDGGSPADLQRILDGVAARVQGIETERPAYRTHKVSYGRQVPAAEVEQATHELVRTLATRLERQDDPVTLAAWVEQELDRQIHPYADGCGRTSKLAAVLVLASRGSKLPLYPNRDVYYSALEGSLPHERGPRRPAVDAYLAKAPLVKATVAGLNGEAVFQACYRHWIDPPGDWRWTP